MKLVFGCDALNRKYPSLVQKHAREINAKVYIVISLRWRALSCAVFG
jgi:hypothetical protein